MTEMRFEGLLIGAATFLIIGLFHPIVIKAEYNTGTRLWWVFLLVGLAGLAVDIFWIKNVVLHAIIGAFSFSSFWSIGELFEQKKRVERGWFPRNPKRKY